LQVGIPNDGTPPQIGQLQKPTRVLETEPINVVVQLTDANTGNTGVRNAVLLAGYESTTFEIAGQGPGDNGDGVWQFTIPAQTGMGGKSMSFRIRAMDGAGRVNEYGDTVRILGSNEDSDKDTLPDWWEYQHFANLSQSPSGDPDNDGIRNELEWQFDRNPADAADSPLAARWTFDDGAANDSSGKGINGTVYGAGGTTSAVRGKAMFFQSAGDRIDFGFSPALKSQEFTLHGFVYPFAFPNGGEAVIWSNLGKRSGLRVFLNAAGQFGARTSGSEGDAELLVSNSLRSDRWYQFAVICDGVTLELWIDGHKLADKVIAGRYTPALMTERTVLGNLATPAAANQFMGRLDEVHYWNAKVSPKVLGEFAGCYVEGFESNPDWQRGSMGYYPTDDSQNFAWQTDTKLWEVRLPNRASDPTQVFAWRALPAAAIGGSFTFRFDVTVTTPGFDSPLRVGLAMGSPNDPWGFGDISVAFAFRTSGFRLELAGDDLSSQQQRFAWPDGYRLDDPPRWVRSEYAYDAAAKVLRFRLLERDTGVLLATHAFQNVPAYSLSAILISQRGDVAASSSVASTTVALLDNIEFLPFSVPAGATKGDFDVNGKIDGIDLDAFSRTYGRKAGDAGYNALGDFDEDGTIDIMDLDAFTRAWGRQY
jgi:hypothetical protein